MYYAQARYYMPEIGRFISEDPWQGTIAEPTTMNPYSDVQNNPIKYVDPKGLRPLDLSDEWSPRGSLSNTSWNCSIVTEGQDNEYYISKDILTSIGYDEKILDDNFMNGLDDTIRKYIIDESLDSSINNSRIAHFLAQISHESGFGKWKVELADIDYMNDTFGPAGTKDSKMGDIVNEKNGLRRYCGAGYMQLSTRENYKNFSISMEDPEILNQGVYYVAENYSWQAAGWWWENNNMNDYIDSGHSVKEVSVRVNGGTNGLQDRIDAYNKIAEYLN